MINLNFSENKVLLPLKPKLCYLPIESTDFNNFSHTWDMKAYDHSSFFQKLSFTSQKTIIGMFSDFMHGTVHGSTGLDISSQKYGT